MNSSNSISVPFCKPLGWLMPLKSCQPINNTCRFHENGMTLGITMTAMSTMHCGMIEFLYESVSIDNIRFTCDQIDECLFHIVRVIGRRFDVFHSVLVYIKGNIRHSVLSVNVPYRRRRWPLLCSLLASLRDRICYLLEWPWLSACSPACSSANGRDCQMSPFCKDRKLRVRRYRCDSIWIRRGHIL